jgi:hypothetical protein
MRVVKRVLRIAAIPLALYVMLVIAVWWGQRSLLFFPSHTLASTSLTPWRDDNQHIIGYCREVTNAQNIWLMTHGNAGQAADRDYVLSRMSARDSLYVLEYPGYGQRPGRLPWSRSTRQPLKPTNSCAPGTPTPPSAFLENPLAPARPARLHRRNQRLIKSSWLYHSTFSQTSPPNGSISFPSDCCFATVGITSKA